MLPSYGQLCRNRLPNIVRYVVFGPLGRRGADLRYGQPANGEGAHGTLGTTLVYHGSAGS
jgi:hypothetical protein